MGVDTDAATTQDRPYTEHVEPPAQGGAEYVRCRSCGAELIKELGGWENLWHSEDCPHADGDL